MEPTVKHAYGAFLGMLCGDAAGATLEFYRKPITETIAEKAMRMPGGGALNVGKGQITDDSELALSLAFALYDKNPKEGFPTESVARAYSNWYHSRPFDMGSTCARAFSVQPDEDGNYSNRMMRQANQGSFVSEANGALMRVTPVALWSLTESTLTIVHNAKMDALLSHPNPVCQDCNALFCLAIVHLIKHPGDYQGAISMLEDYAQSHVLTKVKDWLMIDSIDIEMLDAKTNIGHVRWGFTMAMHFLRNGSSFEEAIKKTLLKGGDTDTNCAIVGAIMGALHGVDGIPEYMRVPVISFDVENPESGHRRPVRYNASNVGDLTHYLITHLPVKHRKA
jgi:ADP-ribosylglycohydrolase